MAGNIYIDINRLQNYFLMVYKHMKIHAFFLGIYNVFN